MNRINTNFNGGFPLNLNDLRFMDDATRLAMKDVIKSFAGDQACYMNGCDIVIIEGDSHAVGEGAIFYQGEIWHVYPHTIDYPDEPVWAFYVSYDADGNKTFKDGLQHDTYEKRTAILCYPGSYPSNTLYTISAGQVENLKNLFLSSSFALVTFFNNTSILAGSTLLLGKSIGIVILQGQINNPYVPPEGVVVLSIPAEYCPVTPISGYMPGKISGLNTWIMLRYRLDTAGNFTFYSPDGQGYNVDIDVCLTFLNLS